MNWKKIAFGGLAVLSIAWFIGNIKSRKQNTPPPLPLPQVARAYNMYSNDPNTDIYGSPREYRVTKLCHDRVFLASDETQQGLSIKIWNNFKGHLEFNPHTGQGTWTGEEDGDYQKASVQLTPNGYNGFLIEFTYQKTGNRRIMELAPVL
jgi:hypothetical protein